ncbi:hypothetical protein PYW08_006031 [Mythimna loreyi]|uniref:Uncharacterized protein n=1 Tax=Mythimna loreyi TaxID=667449 RepID=A0ACC2QLV5_9NEOP|nr:hypothetical protein PYW08_006031 [Mythimna loreyi]
MRVKHCTQVFSQSVGVGLACLADMGVLDKESHETADLLMFFDNLFDSVNGSFSDIRHGKINRAAVTPTSPHRNLWNYSIPILKTMRFVSFNSTQSVCHRCWQRVDRNVLNPVEHEPEVPPPVPVPIPVPPLQNDVQGSNDGELYVPSYKRAPNTSSHCIFGACSNENRRRIPKTIKLYMITTHQLYIPQHARVCREHLESNMWDELENHCTISHYFTAEHFTDVCNIFTEGIISNKQYDFETMVGLNDDSLHFWVGLNGKDTKEQDAKPAIDLSIETSEYFITEPKSGTSFDVQPSEATSYEDLSDGVVYGRDYKNRWKMNLPIN